MLIAVVRHGRAIFGDGDDNLVGDGVDLQNAVHDHERYVREVLIRVLEVARSDAHGVFARVRALRSPRGGFGRLDALGHVVQLIVSRHGLVALDAVLIAVVRHDVAVLGDGDGNLVGHGGDRHIAVDHCLDGHVVVGAGDGEGVLGQTHGRRANFRASGDGEYIGLEADRNLVRLAGEAVVVAVRLVLLAVVHSRFIDARDGDGGRSLFDGQRAGIIGYIIIGRNCAAVVFDGIRINHVRGAARVGDGGGRRHGEGEVLLLVAVDQTLHCEIGLGQRLAVVGLLRVPGGDGQGHSVIDRDDIFGFVSRDRDGLRGGIAGHNGGGIGGIERIALVRRQRFADGLGAGLVFGNLDGGAVQVMMDGVARGVELEVQLQHQRTVACDVAGKHVVLVIRFEHVLVVFLSRLIGVGNENFRVRGGRALVAVVERVSAIAVLIVELDGVLGVGVRRPDGVEDVLAVVVVYLHLRIGGDGAFALGVSVPALEGIANAGEGVGGFGGDGRVVGEVFNHVLACAAIGFIGQGCASGTRAPLGGEGDDVPFIGVIALDLVLIAGLVGGRAVSPAEEVLAIISNQLARGHEVSKAVLRVGLAIHRSGYVVLAGNIFYSEGAVLGVVGVEGDIRCDMGLGVEGLAGAILAGTPAAPGIAFANLRHDFRLLFVQRGFNRVALRDVECNRRTSTFDGQIDCAVIYGLVPLGIDRDVLRGHGLAGEGICLFTRRVGMPAAKIIILHAGGFDSGRIASRVRNALFELLGDGIYRLAAAHVYDVVAVAGVVEFGVVVASAYRGTWRAIKSKAGNRVLIFHGYSIACARAGIRMVQLIGDAANRFAALARKHFYIVVGRFGVAAGLRAIEGRAIQWHCFNVNLIRSLQAVPIAIITICRPRIAIIVCRPFVSDERAIFSSNPETCNFLPVSIRSPVELHLIHIALIIHIHDRRAVARDGLLRNGLRGEAGIALRRRVGLRAGSAGPGFGFPVGILIVIGVFQPVDDGVARIGIGRPDGVERQRLIERLPEGKRRAAHGCRPVAEGIAGAGGGGGLGGRAVALYERGRDIGAALRIVGDPVTVLNPGREGYVAAVQRDGG